MASLPHPSGRSQRNCTENLLYFKFNILFKKLQQNMAYGPKLCSNLLNVGSVKVIPNLVIFIVTQKPPEIMGEIGGLVS